MPGSQEAGPRLELSLDLVPDGPERALRVQYRVENPFDNELLLFDRRWSPTLNAFDPAWVEVVFDGAQAVLSRWFAPRPPGATVDRTTIPYGRLLAPGAVSTSEVLIPIPLRERGPRLASTRAALAPDEQRRVAIERVEFRLGWCVLRDRAGLPRESREGFERDGETLFTLPAYLIAPAQQVAVSPQYPVTLEGERYAGGVL